MADGTGKLPIIACTREALQFSLKNARLFLPAAILCALLAQVGFIATLMAGSTGGTSVADALAVAPAILASVMFTGAVLRKAVRDEFAPPVGLSIGADEGRLIGVGASVVLLALPFVFIGGIILSVFIVSRSSLSPAEIETMSSDPAAMQALMEKALGPAGTLAVEGAGNLLLRIALGIVAFMQAAAIGVRRIMIFQALRWMRGNFLRAVAAILLVAIPIVVIDVAMTWAGLSVIGASGTPSVFVVLAVNAVIALISLLTSIPVSALGAILYRGLRPADAVAK